MVTDALVERAARATFEHIQKRGNWKGYTFDDPTMVNVRKTHLALARLVLEMGEQPQQDMWYGLRFTDGALVAVTQPETRHSLACLAAKDAGATHVGAWNGETWMNIKRVST